jgi:hypothetical protein
MSDKQKLTAQCSNLQRANEQLSELVGFLSVDHLSLTECDGQELTPGSSSSCSSSSTETETGMWFMQQEEAHAAHFQQKVTALSSETL